MGRVIDTLRKDWDQFKHEPEVFFAPDYWYSAPIMNAMAYPRTEGEPTPTPQEQERRYTERLQSCKVELAALALQGKDLVDYLEEQAPTPRAV